jgi:transcriptional regulatory protein RtcR
MKKRVVIGLLGPSLDQGKGLNRWDRWRPTVAMCQHPDLKIDRLELLHAVRYTALAELVARDVAQVSPETEVRRHTLELDDPWDLEEVYAGLHDFARAYPFKPEREEYLIHITTGTHIAQICVFLLTEAGYFPARLLQTSPGKSVEGSFSIIDLDLSRYDRIASRFRKAQREGLSALKGGIDTRNLAFNALIERVEQVAVRSREPILLTGATGSGKSQLAQRIYALKKARHQVSGDFVEVNCATLRGDGAMSMLFGHVKGAFTGAASDRPGMLRKADHGVLFLDEIGELGSDEQAMLLRAIEEGWFYPVGSDKEARSSFQLIAGTNRDLATDPAFRDDLHARINLWTFRLPSLPQRPEDLEPNLDFELERCAEALQTRIAFSADARARFLAFATSREGRWPGNFRDFNAAVRRMATLSPGGRIGEREVNDELQRLRAAWAHLSGRTGETEALPVLTPRQAKALDPFDRVQLEEVIRVCRQSPTLSEAGRRLFEVSRTLKKSANDADRLRKYLARFDLEWSDLQKE